MAAIIVQIVYLRIRIVGSDDLSFDSWTVVLITQVVQAASLTTACVPHLKPFLEALETGMIQIEGNATRLSHGGAGYSSNSSRYNKMTTSKKSGSPPSAVRMEDLEGLSGVPHSHTTTVSAKGRGGDADGQSQSSQSRIIQTLTFSVSGKTQGPNEP